MRKLKVFGTLLALWFLTSTASFAERWIVRSHQGLKTMNLNTLKRLTYSLPGVTFYTVESDSFPRGFDYADKASTKAKIMARPNDPLYLSQWYLENVGQEGLQGTDIGYNFAFDLGLLGDPAVKIWLIDTGISDHPDLLPADERITVSGGKETSGAVDLNGHGTMMSGIIHANTNNGLGVAGIASNATLNMVKTFNAGGISSIEDIIIAIDVIARKVRPGERHIVNASWGVVDGEEPLSLRDAISALGSLGVIWVSAAGNETSVPVYPGRWNLPNQIVVGSSGPNDEKMDFSPSGLFVTLMAPGFDILTTSMGSQPYTAVSGTSASAAVVSGCLALAWSYYKGLDFRSVGWRTAFGSIPIEGLKQVTRSGKRAHLPSLLSRELKIPAPLYGITDKEVYCPLITSYDSQSLVILSDMSTGVNATLDVFDRNGNLVWNSSHSTYLRRVIVSPGITKGFSGSARIRSSWDSLMKGETEILVGDSIISLPFRENKSLSASVFDIIAHGNETGYAVFNPQSFIQNVTIVFRRPDAQVVGESTIALGPNQSISKFLFELIPQSRGVEGFVNVTANADVIISAVLVAKTPTSIGVHRRVE